MDKLYPQLDTLYKDIHANPELGFQEHRTAGILAKQIRDLGFAVTEGVGQTGVVGLLENGPGPTVLVRTELDALPIKEQTGLPYASNIQVKWRDQTTYVAHSCGHDLHMACWVGSAAVLTQTIDQWSGRLMFVAQPAEEITSGAKAMIDDRLYERFGKPDYAFALHSNPSPFGIYYRPGLVSSSSDTFEITFPGKGGHGSNPAKTIDPVVIASRFVIDVQTVVSREKEPDEFGVVTVGAVDAGTAANIIPDHAVVRGTIRAYDPAVRDKLVAGVQRTANAASEMAGAPAPSVTIGPHTDSVVNDPELTERLGLLFAQALHKEQVHTLAKPVTGSEDYSELIKPAGIRSCFFRLGIYAPGTDPMPSNHSPAYKPVPEPSIRLGVQAMTLAAQDALSI